MAFSHLISNPVAILKAAGYREADNREPLEKQVKMGADLCFQASCETAVDVLPQHAISTNKRRATLSVRAAFWAGGGDLGGSTNGGDLRHVDARAFDQTNAMVALLENPVRYDAQTTGINRRNWRGTEIVAEGERVQVREILMDVEWEQNEDPRAVAA